jgi:lipoprotein-anchoring transpeptidase ErfK/SrfK
MLMAGALYAQETPPPAAPSGPSTKPAVVASLTPPSKPAAPVKKASELIKKQLPPVVNKDVEKVINPDNSYVVISLAKQRAWMMVGAEQVYIDSPISSGKRAGMTPVGIFTVTQKNKDHRSSIYGDYVDKRGRTVRRGISRRVDSAPAGTRYVGAPMKFFCRLTGDGVGMHVGKLPGYPASHGCIRLPEEIAPLIYEKVKLGTPVEIRAE